MTNEQIIELVKEHFIEWEADEDGYCWTEFAGKPNAFLKFARAIRTRGWDEGYEYATEIHTDEINLLREELKKLGKVL